MSGEGGSGGEGEASEQDEPSSSSSTEQNMEDLLENFRQQWQQELDPSQEKLDNNSESVDTNEQSTDEAKARSLFLEGVTLEGEGKLHEATSSYRKAVQLVPDIEVRIYAQQDISNAQPTPKKINKERPPKKQGRVKPNNEDVQVNLTAKFQRLLALQERICEPDSDNKMAHVSCLPPELLLLVLRWVVSSDLDLRSLENCSEVSRGFYLVCRDQEIWRLICARVWGPSNVKSGEIPCWRERFISCPRVHFHGAYISRTTYIRPGEQSFQDAFYRLWHSVQYYRYIRFFPGGTVLMFTSSEEPALCVGHLRYMTPRNPAVNVGRYVLHGNLVSMELYNQSQATSTYSTTPSSSSSSANNNNNRYRGRRRNQVEIQHDSGEKTFHVDLQIAPYRNKNNFQLSWQRYCIETKYNTAPRSVCNFELCSNKFPPLWFSRVKSYMGQSETCL